MQDNVNWKKIFRVEGKKKEGISPADLDLYDLSPRSEAFLEERTKAKVCGFTKRKAIPNANTCELLCV